MLLPTPRWLCHCPSPSAPAHRAGSSPGPSSPSGPLRSGETKAAVSQSGAGRPPQPYPGLLMSSTGNSVAPQPTALHTASHPSMASGSPRVPLQKGLTCRPAGKKSLFRGGSEASRPPNLPVQPPRPPATQPCPRHRHGCPGGLLTPLSLLAWPQVGPASHLGFQSHSQMG